MHPFLFKEQGKLKFRCGGAFKTILALIRVGSDPTKFQPERSRSDHNLIRTESSKRSKELEYELSMADERIVFLLF